MIDTYTYSPEHFDLDAMFEAYCDFVRSWDYDVDPVESVILLDGFDAVPMPNYDGIAPRSALVEDGTLVFLGLHQTPADDTTLCVDGTHEDSDNLDIGLGDVYGILVELRDGTLSIHPALYDGSSGPRPSVTIQGTCSCMEKRIDKFVRRFAQV